MASPPINPAQSLYLDLLRGGAALLVVFHHYSNHIVASTHRVFPNVGKEAVIIFFVVSGFVIAMVSRGKERDFGVFAIKRISRFYSVVGPVVILFFVAYALAMVLDHAVYENWGNLERWPAKTLAALTFTTDTALWQRVYLPGGKPMWSLTYEFWYYFLFAFSCLFTPRIAGLAIAALIAIIIGVPFLLLLPVWLVGVGAFHIHRTRPPGRHLAWVLAVGGVIGLVGLQRSGWGDSWLNTRVLFSRVFGDATDVPYLYLVALLVGMNLVGIFALLARRDRVPAAMVATGIRRLAGTSFFLYLTHMPVMLLLKAWLGGDGSTFSIPALAIGFAFVIGKPVENLRFPLQRLLFRWRGSPAGR